MNDRWTDLLFAGIMGLLVLAVTASYLLIVVAAWKVVFG